MIEGILLAHPLSIPIREEGARTESKRRRVDWVGWRGRGGGFDGFVRTGQARRGSACRRPSKGRVGDWVAF